MRALTLISFSAALALASAAFFHARRKDHQNHNLKLAFPDGTFSLDEEGYYPPVRAFTAQCSRNKTCERCTPYPTLPPPVFAATSRKRNIVFLGDSVMAQLECDFRMALLESGVTPRPGSDGRSTIYPEIKASTVMYGIGCPWYCGADRLNEQMRILQESVPNSTTHLVFNLGAHYSSVGMLAKDLDSYRFLLLNLTAHSGAKAIVRTNGLTHFDNPTGEWNGRDKDSNFRGDIHRQCSPIKKKVVTLNHRLNELLIQFANELDADVVDITTLSDDFNSHPQSEFDPRTGMEVPTRDCLHLCLNCDMARAWNSMLLMHLR